MDGIMKLDRFVILFLVVFALCFVGSSSSATEKVYEINPPVTYCGCGTGAEKTYSFTIEESQNVKYIKVSAMLSSNASNCPISSGVHHITIKNNDNDVFQCPDISVGHSYSAEYTRESNVNFDVSIGDTLTFNWTEINVGCVGGPITITLSGSTPPPEISISPKSFSLGMNLVDSFDLPSISKSIGGFTINFAPNALTYDGTYLWAVDSNGDKIYQFDKNGTTIDSFKAPNGGALGLTFDGTYLLHFENGDNFVYTIDILGNIIDSFVAPADTHYELAFDGSYLWCIAGSSTKGYRVCKLDDKGKELESFNIALTPNGMEHDGQYFWIVDSATDVVYKLDNSGNIINQYDLSDYNPEGFTYDGTNYWTADFTKNKLYKLELSDSVNTGASMVKNFKITNPGHSDLLISAMTVKGINAFDFHIQNDTCTNNIISPSGSSTVEVVFQPNSGGTKNATLEIISNDPNMPILSIPLNGIAIEKTPVVQPDWMRVMNWAESSHPGLFPSDGKVEMILGSVKKLTIYM
jgi:hypothetical protein